MKLDYSYIGSLYAFHKLNKRTQHTYKIYNGTGICAALLFFFFLSNTVQAQTTHTITGTVRTAGDGKAVEGASILTDDKSALSDKDGNFSIVSGLEKGTLRIKHIGYKTQYISYAVGRPLAVELVPENNQLDEAVVIGYGTTTRRFSTGSVTKVSAKDIEHQPVSNPMLALQGLVPGLEVTPSSGINGAAVNLKIRGTASLAQGSDPLVVLDGSPIAVNGQSLSQLANATGSGGISLFNGINPNDIESIEILKDADATAIYGSRGANGVILITTKRNHKEGLRLNMDSKWGMSIPSNPMRMLNTAEYLSMRREAFTNSGVAITEQNAPDLLLMDTTVYTDYGKYLNGSGQFTQDINLGLSGGSGNTFFRVNGNYQRENFQVIKDRSSNRSSFSGNVNHRSDDRKFNMDLSTVFSHSSTDLPVYDPSALYVLPPHLELRKDDGSLNWEVGNTSFRMLGLDNPLAQFEKTYRGRFDNLSANLSLGYLFFSDWQFKVSAGYTNGANKEKLRFPSTSIDPGTSELPSSQQAEGSNSSWIAEPQLIYVHSFGEHHVNGLLGASIQQNRTSGSALYGTNYVNDNLLGDIAAAGNIRTATSESVYKYAALFARMGYRYGSKYLFNFSARRDGSSRFGPGRRFATFYAIAGAWVFSEENFVKKLLPGLGYGKLRGSIGTTGNDKIGNYMFMDTWGSVGVNYESVAALQPSRLFNANYAWETNRKFELALELGLFEDRLIWSLSYHRNRSGNQLISYKLPYTTGFSNVNRNWNAAIVNRGWEFSINGALVQSQDFSWNIKANLAIPKNTLLSFPGIETSTYANSYKVGESLSVRRFYHYLGIDKETGRYMFDDINHDGVFNNEDKTTWRDMDPLYYGGLSNSFSYKKWSFGFLLDFKKQDGLSYMASLSSPVGYGLVNHPAGVMDRWQNPGDDSRFQRYLAIFEDPAYAGGQLLTGSDAVVVDASYIKLRNCYLGYSWRVDRRHADRQINLFLTAQNLLTFSGYEGDPEIQQPIVTTPMRNISLGVKINL